MAVCIGIPLLIIAARYWETTPRQRHREEVTNNITRALKKTPLPPDKGIWSPGRGQRCLDCGGRCMLGFSGWYHVWPNDKKMPVAHEARTK